jgi:hypothetical protein
LVEEGKIRMLFSGGRMTRFDPMIAEHDHFICWQCDRVIDLVVESDRQANLAPLVEQGYTIATQSLSIHGLCQQCSQQPVGKSREKANVEHREQQLRRRGRPAPRKEEKIKEYG